MLGGGKLVRLMLIQVQLLKTEGLRAMGAIDDLVDANRLNVQLLASVPAVVLVLGGYPALFNTPWEGVARIPRCVKAHDVRSFHPGQVAIGSRPPSSTWRARAGCDPCARMVRVRVRVRVSMARTRGLRSMRQEG